MVICVNFITFYFIKFRGYNDYILTWHLETGELASGTEIESPCF
jgi:hypothetical protein